MFNSFTIAGYLGADPELRYTPEEGVAVANFSVAVTRRRGEESSPTDWFRVVTWRKLAEACAAHLTKGRPVLVKGPMYVRKYTDREGIQRTSYEVHANRVVFLPSGNSGGNNSANSGPAPTEYSNDDVPF